MDMDGCPGSVYRYGHISRASTEKDPEKRYDVMVRHRILCGWWINIEQSSHMLTVYESDVAAGSLVVQYCTKQGDGTSLY